MYRCHRRRSWPAGSVSPKAVNTWALARPRGTDLGLWPVRELQGLQRSKINREGPVGYFAGVHPCLHLNGRRRGGSAARCDALLKSFPRDAAASFSAQVLHSRPRRYAEFHDGDPLKSFQESPHKVGLVPREGHSSRTCAKTGAPSWVLVWDKKPKSAT